MKTIFITLIISSLGLMAFIESQPKVIQKNTVKAITFSELQDRLQNTNDQLLVCNFWATWCKPCVEEMPYFEQLHTNYQDENVTVLFVSLDNPSLLKKRVQKFVDEKGIKAEVVVLSEPNLSQDEWIPKVNETWQGDIPVTIFVNSAKGVREFHTGSFEDYNELETKLKTVM